MGTYDKFAMDRNKYKKGIMDIYNPEGNSFEKENEEKATLFEKNKDLFRQYASFYRSFPDAFLDDITPKDSNFKLFFYQRVFLRVAMRYKYVYATFTRAFSKSFLSVLALYLKCIMYPHIFVFVSSSVKEQACTIAREKIELIWEIWPLLQKEVRKAQFQKDYIRLEFHNGSKFDILAESNSARGSRRNCGLFEELLMSDGQVVSEVLIPTLNVNRMAMCGGYDQNEPHKAQIFVTTAGHKSSFAYDKLISLLVFMVARGNAFVFGGDWRIPVMHNLLDPHFVDELREDGSFSDASFSREYESIWSGTSEDAFFSADLIDRHRILEKPETTPNPKEKKAEYIICADVARRANEQNADTAVIVMKLIPRSNGSYQKHIVNIHTIHGTHFLEQSINLKKLVFHYNARQLIVDANGLGVGLVDYLIKENIDEKTGEIFPPFSVTNDPEYDQYKTKDSLPLLYNVKALASNNSQIHVNCLSQISSGKVKFLIDQMTARAKVLNTKEGQTMSSEQLTEYLIPYATMDILKEEMLNLQQKQEGKNLKLERINKRVNKDKFSALEYGLWYVKSLEDKVKKKVDVDPINYFFAKKPKLR